MTSNRWSTPWRDNNLLRAAARGVLEAVRQHTPVALFARLAYHAGVMLGLLEQRLNWGTHAK